MDLKAVRKIMQAQPKAKGYKPNPDRIPRAARVAMMRAEGLTNFSGRQWRKFRKARRRTMVVRGGAPRSPATAE